MRTIVAQLLQTAGINQYPAAIRRPVPVTRTTWLSIAFVTVIALSIMPSESAAYIPPPPQNPAIEDFYVNWELIDEELELYRFTFSGRVVECEGLEPFEVVLFGGPFSGTVVPGSGGNFSIEFTATASQGFSNVVVAHIHAYGHRVSPYVSTST